MELKSNEIIKLIMARTDTGAADLAARLGMSRQNLYNRLKADTLTLQELKKYAAAMGYKIVVDIAPFDD